MAKKAVEKKTAKKTTPKQEKELMREKDGTIVLTITIPHAKVEEARKKITDKAIKNVEVSGFRKGTAPKKIAEKNISKEKIKEETLRSLIPDAYAASVKKNNLNPIITPKIHIDQFADGTDIKFKALTAEEPEVKLGSYKDKVKKVTAKSKIVVPGKEQKKPTMGEIVEAAMEDIEVNVPKILVDQEVNRLLSQLLDELKRLGMTIEQYLESGKKTAETLRKEYEEKAENDLKLEFALRKIAQSEKITVEEKDIKDALDKVEDPNRKEEIAKNPYLIAGIIRQQKTLDFLANL